MTSLVEIDYSPASVATIVQRVLTIQAKNRALGRNTIVCITGGSSTGKSTQIAADLHQQLPDSQIVSQDNFQLGIAYADQAGPVYRWDALDNYGIPESVDLLQLLQTGQAAELPVYTFQEFRRTGVQTIQPTPILLFEGLYAGFGELRSVADLLIYAESPLYARMLRRVFRSCFERYRGDPALALKSFLSGSVLNAHRDLVRQQRDTADVIFRMPYLFAETIQRFKLEKRTDSFSEEDSLYSSAIDDESALQVETGAQGGFQVNLIHRNDTYFSFPIDAGTFELLLTTELMQY